MVALNFETKDEHREGTGFNPLPPNWYPAQITASDYKANKANTGHYLKLELEILGNNYAGRKIFDQLNLDNPNTQAVEIAEKTLTQICDAVGKERVDDSEELHYQPLMIKLGIRPAKGQYDAQNEIKGYKAKDGANGQRPQAGKPAARPAAKKAPPAQASGKKQPPWAQQGG